MISAKQHKKIRRTRKTRTKIVGKKDIPRLSVYRSHRSLYVQVIDDQKSVTLAAAHSRELGKISKRIIEAEKLGERVAKKALDKKIVKVRFDRGGYKYHGLVAAIAKGARNGGLKF